MASFANVPQQVGLPVELSTSLDSVPPHETRSTAIRVYALNTPSVTSTITQSGTANAQPAEISMPQTDINFDIPCSQGSSVWLDTRVSTLNFRATITCTTASTTPAASANLRSSAYAYFDTLTVKSGTGGIIEQIPELGLTADTLLLTQMDYAQRINSASLFGFDAPATDVGTQGHTIPVITGNQAANNVNTFSYSLPLISAALGVTADRFLPIGLLKKLFLTLTTSAILPITVMNAGQPATAGVYSVVLSDFTLQLETVDIGQAAMSSLMKSLPDGRMYLHGTTYKTTTANLTASQGLSNLPVGLTGSSCKSLFVRFYELGAPGITNSCNGKYSSKCPMLNQVGWNIAGQNFPQSGPLNPLLYPSQVFRNLQVAIGAFNSTQYRSSILPSQFQKLSAGGTSTGQNSSTQDWKWTTGDSATVQSAFLYGESLEKIARRGIIGGADLQFQKINLVLQTSVAPTNAHTVYIHGMFDTIFIIDPESHDVVSVI